MKCPLCNKDLLRDADNDGYFCFDTKIGGTFHYGLWDGNIELFGRYKNSNSGAEYLLETIVSNKYRILNCRKMNGKEFSNIFTIESEYITRFDCHIKISDFDKIEKLMIFS